MATTRLFREGYKMVKKPDRKPDFIVENSEVGEDMHFWIVEGLQYNTASKSFYLFKVEGNVPKFTYTQWPDSWEEYDWFVDDGHADEVIMAKLNKLHEEIENVLMGGEQ